jgi:hypothetical protein
MNERIFELAEQAHEETYRVMGSACLQEAFDDFYTEKFAELIVRECIQTIKNASMDSGDEWEDGLRFAQGAIEEHFGVEERKGWVCPKCGVDRTREACPKGHMAAVTGDCPMTATAQSGVAE